MFNFKHLGYSIFFVFVSTLVCRAELKDSELSGIQDDMPVEANGNFQQYRERNVKLVTTDNFNIYGTLLEPNKNESNTVAIIIPSSGTTDRDGNRVMMRNNSIKLLASALSNKSIATLRFDKRGVGESVMDMVNPYEKTVASEYTTYVKDIQEWVKELREVYRFNKVILIGHSEGSLLGMIAASENPKLFDGIISIAGIGRPVETIVKSMFETNSTEVKSMVDDIITSLKNGQKVETVPVYLSHVFSYNLQNYVSSILTIDPKNVISDIKSTPILLIHGDKDVQMKLEDATILRSSNENSRLIIIKGMNHVLKDCSGSTREEQLQTYINPSIPINDNLVSEVVNFINKI